jgi:hypothetical protein
LDWQSNANSSTYSISTFADFLRAGINPGTHLASNHHYCGWLLGIFLRDNVDRRAAAKGNRRILDKEVRKNSATQSSATETTAQWKR